VHGEAPHRDVVFDIDVDREQEIGTYANLLGAWSSPYEFTLDFCQTQQPGPADPNDETSDIVLRCRLAARIKIPVTQIFDVIALLNDTMTDYERRYGEITRPGEGGRS
jgi:Protein of unknown function (DUF3467)